MRFWSCIIIRVRGIDDTGKAEAKPHVAIDLKNDLDFFEIISTNFSKFLDDTGPSTARSRKDWF